MQQMLLRMLKSELMTVKKHRLVAVQPNQSLMSSSLGLGTEVGLRPVETRLLSLVPKQVAEPADSSDSAAAVEVASSD
jgi:hypothetical protein